MKCNGNYFFLGIAIGYLILAFIEWRLPGVLPATVYVTIAQISLSLTIFEFFKNLSDNVIKINKSRINIAKTRCLEIEKELSVIKSGEEIQKLQDEKTYMTEEIIRIKQSKTERFVKKAYCVLNALQIVTCMVLIIVLPLKKIPYDMHTTKMLNFYTLITFSAMFFSYFVSSLINDVDERWQEKWLVNQKTSKYYLNLIEKTQKDD